mmetsp:Transcript_44610/g.104881  ORF Transcript_44610/g.104881 Transcript_44610/m.104881 type:complete len:530 (+) Transcript_44610:1-1590(+)
MKALLLDRETTGIVSVAYSQSSILQKEVFLVERLDTPNRAKLLHLRAIVFLRPTIENLRALKDELRSPKFGEYHLFFSNVIPDKFLRELGEADQFEVVMEVQEFFADFFAFSPCTISLNLSVVTDASMTRICDGLTATLLALKRRPCVRFRSGSTLCQRVAREVTSRMEANPALFDFRRLDAEPLLLIMDRKDDPVTPLLSQWTYQAMVHELFGVSNNRVDLREISHVPSDLKELVLAPEQDQFYRENMYSTFGDLGERLGEIMKEFQRQTQQNMAVESIGDMQRFVESYPEFRKFKGNVSRHITLTSELARIIADRNLMELSILEQHLACVHDHKEAFRRVQAMLDHVKITHFDRLRLVMLYSLRYEAEAFDQGNLDTLLGICRQQGVPAEMLEWPRDLRRAAGNAMRPGVDLFGRKFLTAVKSGVKRNIRGVDNVYCQHEPMLQNVLKQVMDAKLPESVYPFACGAATKDRPQDVVIFFVGGGTYEEAKCVASFNSAPQGTRLVYAATSIHNSASFVRDFINGPDLA